MYKGVAFALLLLSHFHRIFKWRGGGGGSNEPSLDPPLVISSMLNCKNTVITVLSGQ